jgi:hypothetical protein
MDTAPATAYVQGDGEAQNAKAGCGVSSIILVGSSIKSTNLMS